MALEILVQTGKSTNLNRSLDLYDDADNFVVNYLIADINNIANTNGTYTKTIEIPDTRNNREIFGYISSLAVDTQFQYDYDYDNSFNPNKKYRCSILMDSIVVLEGYLQLTKFVEDDLKNNKTFSITIYGDNASFYINMGDKLLTDIDFSDLSFTYSIAGIKNSWTSNYRKGHYFPLIDYGHGWTLNDLQSGSSTYKIGVKDFLPAVYVKTIWDKVFKSNGFACNSNFTGSDTKESDERFANLIIPYKYSTFQTQEGFDQDKIFHVGLSYSTLAQNNSYTPGIYAPSASGGPLTLAVTNRNLWYTGYMLSPFETDSQKNTNVVSSGYTWTTTTIPFKCADAPMFDTTYNGNDNFDLTNDYYQNNHNQVFKQRFMYNTHIVTNYNADNRYYSSYGGSYNNPNYFYQMYAIYYREIDPITGTTHPGWASGTGAIIPPDTGSFNNIGATATDGKLWICYRGDSVSSSSKAISNVFDINKKLIVPQGDGSPSGNRYLGKYYTTQEGTNAIQVGYTYSGYIGPGGTPTVASSADNVYWGLSGDCIAYYNNTSSAGSSPVGIWCSGARTPALMAGGSPAPYYTEQPLNGDWYQDLMLPTIWLDGDETHPLYGASGSLYRKGNTPIQPGEKVRLVIGFGARYKGGAAGAPTRFYKPPAVAYLVDKTNFSGNLQANGMSGSTSTIIYQNPGTTASVRGANRSYNQFWNEVSLDYISEMPVNFNDIIPKNVKQRDFIQDVIKMHNLYVEPTKSVPNTLIVEPREGYYALSDEVLDWNDKLDLNSPIDIQVLAETQNRRTRFTYKADSDYYNKQYTNITNEIYGQYINVSDNEFLTSETKIESMFSPTPLVQLYSAGTDFGSTLARPGGFIMPVLVSGTNMTTNSNNKANGAVTSNYRILYKNYINNLNDDQIYLFDSSTHYYPYAGMYDNPYSPAYSINWGQTKGEFFFEPTNLFFDNLVNTYWASLLTELTDADSRIITCYMFLTPNDINNFQFYKEIFLTIDGVDGYYKVNSITDYKPGRNSLCKVTLLKSKTSLVTKKYSGSTNTGGVITSGGSGTSTSTGGVVMAGLVAPMSGLVAGFDNTVDSSSIAVGARNSITTTNGAIVGNDNTISLNESSALILGDQNAINDNSNSIVMGDSNLVSSGDAAVVSGNNNIVSGSNNLVSGNSNNINTLATTVDSTNLSVMGNENTIIGNSSLVIGNSNEVVNEYGLSGSYIMGSNNQISGENLFIFGSNITSTASNQMIIDPNIKVQPASLIQDYTPVDPKDATYPVGAITKDDNNIWVNTTGLGWRQIPFNNSFASLYDTTTQTNPTASSINYISFNSASIASNIGLLDNTKIVVANDGLYNIQFSAQFNKSGGGAKDVDIWFVYNDVAVPWSNTQITLAGNNAKVVAAWNFVQAMTASSYIQLAWSSNDTAVEIFALGTQSSPNRPGIPSVILTIDKISSI